MGVLTRGGGRGRGSPQVLIEAQPTTTVGGAGVGKKSEREVEGRFLRPSPPHSPRGVLHTLVSVGIEGKSRQDLSPPLYLLPVPPVYNGGAPPSGMQKIQGASQLGLKIPLLP